MPTPSAVRRQLEAGDPLLLNYGKLTNDFLFLDYGFVMDSNPYDRVQLRFGVDLIQVRSLLWYLLAQRQCLLHCSVSREAAVTIFRAPVLVVGGRRGQGEAIGAVHGLSVGNRQQTCSHLGICCSVFESALHHTVF